jgi:5'-nucleotidase
MRFSKKWAGWVGVVALAVVIALAPSSQGGETGAPARSTPQTKLTVLLTNDDGYDAPGLRALAQAFQATANVSVAAPAGEQSGKGHSITTSSNPILASERKQASGASWWAIDAPPATAVRVALENLVRPKPDVVISGINRGENLGIVVYYSGTLGAAREAAIVGVPAIAVSMQGNREEDYAATAAYVRELVEQLSSAGQLKPGLFLNVNAPAGERKGVRVTRLSLKPNYEGYEQRSSPRGRPYFWSRWRPLEDDDEGTDVWAFVRGYIAVTPMVLDVTDASRLEPLRSVERAGAAVKK